MKLVGVKNPPIEEGLGLVVLLDTEENDLVQVNGYHFLDHLKICG